MSQVSNWNLANILTMLRIASVPVFGWALLQHDGTNNSWRWIAYGIFAIAMLTDKVDGELARRNNWVTNFGKIADPIADKALTGMAFIGLAIIGELWWWITIVVLLREWAVTIARLSIAKSVVMPATQTGKIKTTLQGLALAGFVAPFQYLTGFWHWPGQVLYFAAIIAMAAAFILTITSGWEFAQQVRKARQS